MADTGTTPLPDGTHIAWQASGHGDPVLLIHGITEDHAGWRELVPALAAHARVIAIDLPGHGASSALPEYSSVTLTSAVAAFVTAAGLDRPHVVGHSLGGLVATLLPALVPVRSVVNVDQPLRLGGFIDRIRAIAPALRGDGFAATLAAEMDALAGPRLPEPVRAELRRYRVPARQKVVTDLWLPLLDQSEADVLAMLEPVLAQVRVPLLALQGSDPGPGYGEWLAARIPGAQCETWDGLGHWLHRVEPDRFLARVREFHAAVGQPG